jgi:hypothetical protein
MHIKNLNIIFNLNLKYPFFSNYIKIFKLRIHSVYS